MVKEDSYRKFYQIYFQHKGHETSVSPHRHGCPCLSAARNRGRVVPTRRLPNHQVLRLYDHRKSSPKKILTLGNRDVLGPHAVPQSWMIATTQGLGTSHAPQTQTAPRITIVATHMEESKLTALLKSFAREISIGTPGASAWVSQDLYLSVL